MPTLDIQHRAVKSNGQDFSSFQRDVEMLQIQDNVKYSESLTRKANGTFLFPAIESPPEKEAQSTPTTDRLSYGKQYDIDVFRDVHHPPVRFTDPSVVPGNLRNSKMKSTSVLFGEFLSRGSLSSSGSPEGGKVNFDQAVREKGKGKVKRVLKERTLKHKIPRSIYVSKHMPTSNKSSSCSPTLNSTRNSAPQPPAEDIRDLATLSNLCKGLTLHSKVNNSLDLKCAQSSHRFSVPKPPSQYSQSFTISRPRLRKNGGVYSKKATRVIPDKANKIKNVEEDDGEAKFKKVSHWTKKSDILMDTKPYQDVLTKVECASSMYEFGIQKTTREKLHKQRVTGARREKPEMDRSFKDEKLMATEKKSELKRRQRREIYALNKVMTDLENSRFNLFMQSAGTSA